MKKLLFLFLFISNLAFAQRVQWQRQIDYSPINSSNSDDDILFDIHLTDTNTFFSTVYTGLMRVPNRGSYYPLILKHRASDGAIIDSFRFFDTTRSLLSCYNKQNQNFWLYMIKDGRISGSVFQKIDLLGRTQFYRSDRFFPIDSVTSYPSKLIPATDGGFYLIGYQRRTLNSQQLRLWQVSRWDSSATRKWVREYMFENAAGNADELEFLPNGNLFVSGWQGSQIMALEIDTANGAMLDRKILYTHPRNFNWSDASVTRTPYGYFVVATEATVADTQKYHASYNHRGQRLFGGFSNLRYIWGTAMIDSSIWCTVADPNPSRPGITYRNFDSLGNLIHSVVISQTNNVITKAGYFTNGSAIFGGNGSIIGRGEHLYFCKIDSIGAPFNPIYPPVGPVLTSNQKVKEEPNLQVYPNPFTNTLRLSHKGTAQLLDVHGRIILSQPVEAGEELKVSSLPKGMYLLRLQSVGGKLYVRKVVRE